MEQVKVTVMPKKSVLDPQGVAVEQAIRHLGVEVSGVRVGKVIELTAPGVSDGKLQEIARDLLSNPVIEDFQIERVS